MNESTDPIDTRFAEEIDWLLASLKRIKDEIAARTTGARDE